MPDIPHAAGTASCGMADKNFRMKLLAHKNNASICHKLYYNNSLIKDVSFVKA
jgi:hypothetical protein